MDWLNERNHFSKSDLTQFSFFPDLPFLARIFQIQRPQVNKMEQTRVFETAEEYVTWLEKVVPSPAEKSPSLVLALHPRVTNNAGSATRGNPSVTSLRQPEETFLTAATHLFQHRSICDVVCRISTTVFTSYEVIWESEKQQYGPSIVYNFKSDTESTKNEDLEDLDDLVMSVTWFRNSRKGFGAMYGCRRETSEDIKQFLDRIEDAKTALHPLLMPMMFFELERKRLLNNFEKQQSDVHQKILDIESGLTRQAKFQRSSDSEEKHSSHEAEKRHKITELWMKASSQRTGFESLKVQLGRMVKHSQWLSTEYFKKKPHETYEWAQERKVSKAIETRLQAIMDECDSKARSYSTLLGGMDKATQMEWNYHSRMDAKANFAISSLAKKDSGQMRTIAILGMVFLPPTFLASFFSMSFFKWIPEDSNQVVSPFIAIWVVLAIGLTVFLRWRWAVLFNHQDKNQTLLV